MNKTLKNSDILKKKPNLNLKPNHYDYSSETIRMWPALNGQAIRDGKGWYKRINE